MNVVTIEGVRYMAQKQCFIRDLKVGGYFRMKQNGGTICKVQSFDQFVYKCVCNGKLILLPSMYPVIPLKKF